MPKLGTDTNQQSSILKKLTIILTIAILSGCYRTSILKNGRTHAPTNPNVFKKRTYFSKKILDPIDTLAIYEKYEVNYYEGLLKQPNVLARLNYKNPNHIYGVYRFYGNGCFSLFFLDRDKPVLTAEMFDPTYTGWRGVLYLKKSKTMGDMFTQVGEMSSALGIETEEFTFHGDTVIVEVKNLHKEVFIKRQIDKKLLEHSADW